MISSPLNILSESPTSSSPSSPTISSTSTPTPTFTPPPNHYHQSDDCMSSSICPVPLSSPVVEWRSEDGCDSREDHKHMLSISLSLLQQLNEWKEDNINLDPKVTQYVSSLFISSDPFEIHKIQQRLITYIQTNPIGYSIITHNHT